MSSKSCPLAPRPCSQTTAPSASVCGPTSTHGSSSAISPPPSTRCARAPSAAPSSGGQASTGSASSTYLSRRMPTSTEPTPGVLARTHSARRDSGSAAPIGRQGRVQRVADDADAPGAPRRRPAARGRKERLQLRQVASAPVAPLLGQRRRPGPGRAPAALRTRAARSAGSPAGPSGRCSSPARPGRADRAPSGRTGPAGRLPPSVWMYEAISAANSSSSAATRSSRASQSAAASPGGGSARRTRPLSRNAFSGRLTSTPTPAARRGLEDRAGAAVPGSAPGRRPPRAGSSGAAARGSGGRAGTARSASMRSSDVASGSSAAGRDRVRGDAVGAEAPGARPRPPARRTPRAGARRTPARRFSSVPWLRSCSSFRKYSGLCSRQTSSVSSRSRSRERASWSSRNSGWMQCQMPSPYFTISGNGRSSRSRSWASSRFAPCT